MTFPSQHFLSPKKKHSSKVHVKMMTNLSHDTEMAAGILHAVNTGDVAAARSLLVCLMCTKRNLFTPMTSENGDMFVPFLAFFELHMHRNISTLLQIFLRNIPKANEQFAKFFRADSPYFDDAVGVAGMVGAGGAAGAVDTVHALACAARQGPAPAHFFRGQLHGTPSQAALDDEYRGAVQRGLARGEQLRTFAGDMELLGRDDARKLNVAERTMLVGPQTGALP